MRRALHSLAAGFALLALGGAAGAQTSLPVQAVQPVQAVRPVQAAPTLQAAPPTQSVEAAPPAQAAPPASPAQSAPPAPEEYRLGAGDVLRITVYDQPDLLTEVEVSEAGTVMMPLVGAVQVGGKTRAEAAGALAESLKRGGFLKEANVVVRVIEFRSQQVSVLGEVNKPGRYPISRPSSVAELISVAGGITAKGSPTVIVTRTDGNGASKREELNVNEQISADAAGKALMLRAGDTIYVPSAPVFYIYGEVRQPGSYPLAPEMTVMQALSVGGGITARGTERGISLERRGADGGVRRYAVRGSEKVQANDVLRIPESWF
jgi:polysaccharide export outer membrane protein